MRRYPLRRNRLKLYRGIFMIGIALTFFVAIKGIAVLASGDYSGALHKIGIELFRSLYIRASSKNNFFQYVAGDESGSNTLFTSLADGISINYYAIHQGKLTVPSVEEYEDENIDVDEELLYAILEYYGTENTMITDSSLNTGDESNEVSDSPQETLEIQYESGNVEKIPNFQMTPKEDNNSDADAVSVGNFLRNKYSMALLNDFSYLMSNFYIVDEKTTAPKELFHAETLLSMDLSIDKTDKGPLILIYHTHASEAFIDSKPGVQADTVVGPGNYLTQLLEANGYRVYHDTTAYDRLPNGEDNRDYAYSTARPSIEKILEENPTIQVVIDLHRDSGAKRVTTINGKDTAQIMLFNGLCRNTNGPIASLSNDYLQANLAMSLQTALMGRKLYSGFVHKNYLKNYRYNMHLMERYLLIELGTDQNTVMEAYNAMEPLATILNQILTNKVKNE